MMSIVPPITPLLRLNTSTSTIEWCIKVRVLRMWTIKSSINPTIINEIHVILLDQEGKKIEATISGQCVDLFSNVLFEGRVYIIAFFYVKDNLSSYMTTLNQFRLIFCMNTIIIPSQSFTIPYYSLMVFNSQRIRSYLNGLSYLIDVIGLITAVHEVPNHEITEMKPDAVKITLSDSRGHFECLLFGVYAEQIKVMMRECPSELPILILQFVKIKSKEGIAYIECVEDVSKLLLNPPIIEVERFKIELGYVNGFLPLDKKENYSSSKPCKHLEFNRLYPHKTIYEFVNMMEDGLFVLYGKLAGLYRVNQWFHPVCNCGNFLKINFGAYYCVNCSITVFSGTSKCNVQIGIRDDTSAALLPMVENLIKGVECLNLNGGSFILSDDSVNALIDKQVLIIVKKIHRVDQLTDDVVEVIRITDDIDVINQFHSNANNFTPSKSVFQAPFVALPNDLNGDDRVSSATECFETGKAPVHDHAFQMLVNVSTAEYNMKYKHLKIVNDVMSGEGCSSTNL